MQTTEGYNPYMNPPTGGSNIISFGGYPQQSSNGYVFAPAPQQQGQYNYYNPYGNTFAQQSYGGNPYGLTFNNQPYNNGYNYNSYGYNYNPYGYNMSNYVSAQSYNDMMFTMAIKTRNTYFGIEMTDEQIHDILHPPKPEYSIEEMEANREWNESLSIYQACHTPQPESRYERASRQMAEEAEKFNQKYGGHSLFQFLNEDLPKLNKEVWEERNLVPLNSRNMSGTYDSRQYNELLNLHRSSNPFINQLLDQSVYDNNVDDYEMGMQAVLEREKRRQDILNGKVPEFISPPELQEQRHKFTQTILNQIYAKGGKVNV